MTHWYSLIWWTNVVSLLHRTVHFKTFWYSCLSNTVLYMNGIGYIDSVNYVFIYGLQNYCSVSHQIYTICFLQVSPQKNWSSLNIKPITNDKIKYSIILSLQYLYYIIKTKYLRKSTKYELWFMCSTWDSPTSSVVTLTTVFSNQSKSS